MAINFRYLSAGMGLLAAAGTITFVMVRLLEAGSPKPTPLRLLNDGPAAVTISRINLGGQVLSGAPLSLAAGANHAHEGRELEPGRPANLSLTLDGVAVAASCDVVRPGGPCTLQARLRGATDLQCEFVCKAADTKPLAQ